MASNGEPSTPSTGPKAIASLAKKPSDVTRQGTQKLKFVPTLPSRRKKEEAKEEAQPPSAQSQDKGNARGRGRGRGRGEGRGAAPRPPVTDMTASGPFAMGPALAGTSTRRSAPRPSFAPVVPKGPGGPALVPSLSNVAAPTSKKDKQRENPLVSLAETAKVESDEELYSEPDEGVEIIDMDNVRQLDWMAPETLRKEQLDRRKKSVVKTESEESSSPSKQGLQGLKDDPSKALDLSESEEEEDLEDLVEDFAVQTNTAEAGIRQERLYFFQFPQPFPTFVSSSAPTPEPSGCMDVDTPGPGPSALRRKVSFATDTKPGASAAGSATPMGQDGSEVPKEAPRVDGVIGQLEVYRSGMVKMRLANGIALNVSEGTPPSFLQQAIHLDLENKTLHVLGKVNKRFIVSPDLDALLASMELADTQAMMLDDTDLIKMDTV